jgi:nitric oxide reductase subunit C
MGGRVRSWGVGGVFLAGVLVILGPWDFTAPRPGPAPPGSTPAGDARHGAALFRRLDCVRCHSEPRGGSGINIPPRLDAAGSRAQADWLAAYIRNPYPLRFRREGVRPRIRMPAAGIPDGDARDLAALLATWRDTVLIPPLASTAWAGADSLARSGETLFEQYQCRGCHELDGRGKQVGPSLDGVGSRRRLEYVMALLLDPKRVIPGTAMKDNQLWDEEARALTAFLMTRKTR